MEINFILFYSMIKGLHCTYLTVQSVFLVVVVFFSTKNSIMIIMVTWIYIFFSYKFEKSNAHSLLIMLNVICKARPNKKKSVFQVTGLKILGRVGTH